MSVIRRHWFAGLMVAAWLVRLPIPAPLWYDEAFTAWLTRLPFSQMIEATRGDVHPPLFYTLEWLVMRLPGATPTALRLLPGVFSLAAVYVLRRIAEELKLSQAAQAVGLGLMALTGWQIYYSQEARSYSLSLLLFLIGVWAGMGQRWRWLFVAFLGLLYTHNTNMIMCLVLGLWALGYEMRRPVIARPDPAFGFHETRSSELRSPLIAGGAALLLWLPWFLYATLPQMKEFTQHWIWPPMPADVILTFTGFLALLTPSYVWSAWFIAISAAVTMVTFWRVFSNREQQGLAFLTLAPVALAVLLSYVWTPLYLARSLIGASATFYLLVGWAVTERVSIQRRAFAAVVMIPVIVLGGDANYARSLAYNRFFPEAVVSTINAGWKPGDIVYSLNVYGLVELEQWLGNRAGYLYPIESTGLHGGGLTLVSRQAMGIYSNEQPLDSLSYRRAWLVVIDGAGLHQQPERDKVLSTHPHELVLSERDERHANSVEVYLLWPANSAR